MLKVTLIVESIGTKIRNINGEKISMNYINVKHLVRLYDVTMDIEKDSEITVTLKEEKIYTFVQYRKELHYFDIIF